MGRLEAVPTREIELGGKKRTLAFTLGALRRIQEVGVEDVDEQSFLLNAGHYVHALLSADDRAELEIADIEELMHPGQVGEVVRLLSELRDESMPEASDDDTDKEGDDEGNP